MKTVSLFETGLIEFGKVECCALAHAFAKNSDFLKEMTGLRAVPIEKLKIFGSIMVNSSSLSFRPNQEMKLAYNLFARAEERRLQLGLEPELACDHSKQNHIEALQSVLSKMLVTIN